MKEKMLISKLLKVKGSKTPIWIMRQAGRYLPEYRKVRSNFKDFMHFCLTPHAAAEVTVQPLMRFDLDAAIIFSDILIIPKALGMDVQFIESIGPVLKNIETEQEVKKFENFDIDVFNKVGQAIKLTKTELQANHPGKTLIGFAGAPFTIAAYMIEGRGSKDFAKVRKFAVSYPKAFEKLLDIITQATIEYLKVQILNGAEVIKLFDSWAGSVPFGDFENHVIKPISKITEALKLQSPAIPIIIFARNSGVKLKRFNELSSHNALAIDQYADLEWCYNNLTINQAEPVLQGNLDNALLAYGDFNSIKNAAEKILSQAQSKHLIFNLGHGILPTTPIDNVKYLIDIVKNFKW